MLFVAARPLPNRTLIASSTLPLAVSVWKEPEEELEDEEDEEEDDEDEDADEEAGTREERAEGIKERASLSSVRPPEKVRGPPCSAPSSSNAVSSLRFFLGGLRRK